MSEELFRLIGSILMIICSIVFIKFILLQLKEIRQQIKINNKILEEEERCKDIKH